MDVDADIITHHFDHLDSSISDLSLTPVTQSMTGSTRSSIDGPNNLPTPATPRGALPWCLLLIALMVAYVGIMIRESFFYADDFLTFGFAHQDGLRWSFVFLNIFGHVAPTERLLHLMVLDISPFNYALGETVILVLFALVLLALLWILWELRVGLAVTLTILFVVGTSTVLLSSSFYYDQTVFLLPASLFILCTVALFIRWTRTGASWLLFASWVVFGLSFVTQERPLVTPVYLVLLRYLILPYRIAPGGKYRWRSDWRIWLPFAAIGGGYTSYYLSLGSNAHTSTSVTIKALEIAPPAFLRAVIGIPTDSVAHGSSVLVVVVLVVLLVWSYVTSPRRTLVLRASVFFVVCFAANILPVIRGIGSIYGPGLVFELQYYVDALFALGIAVGLVESKWLIATLTPRGDRTRTSHHIRRRARYRVAALVCVAAVVIHLVALPFGISNIRRANTGQTIARSWVMNVEASLQARDDRPTTVIPLTLPPSFVPGFESPFNYESEFFPLLANWHDYDSGPVEVTGPKGSLVPTTAGDSVSLTGDNLVAALQSQSLVHLDQLGGTPGSICFAGTGSPGQLVLELPATVSGETVAADLSMTSSRPMNLIPFAMSGTAVTANELPLVVAAGATRLMVAFRGNSATEIGFTTASSRAHFCFSSVQVGSVLIPSGVKNMCNEIDPVGTIYDSVPCGVAWRAPTFHVGRRG